MDKTGQEWVSAAVDGIIENSTLEDLSTDIPSHAKWRNYHIIGDVMRDELPKNFSLDLSANIAKALENEAPIVVTKAKTLAKTQVQADVAIDTAKLQSSKAKVIPLFKQLGQFAIAASVALVAVVGVQNYNQGQDASPTPLPVLDTRPLVGNVSPVSLQTGPVQQFNQPSNDANEQIIQQRRRLNAYIQDHLLQQRLNSEVVLTNNSNNRFD